MANFKMDDYNDVAARIRDFKVKHPEGSLQPADIHDPFRVQTIGDKVFIVYTALAYRTPNDERPGVGVAWEPFPGPTQFTKDSELQNAETSAWGRAIVAALAADTKKGIASAEDVRNRQPEAAANTLSPEQSHLFERIRGLSPEQRVEVRAFCDEHSIPRAPGHMDADQLQAVDAVVDNICIAAVQDSAAEAPQTPVEPPQPAETGEHPTEAPTSLLDTPPDAVDGLQAAIDTVAGMKIADIFNELEKRNLSTSGNAAARAQRLAQALVAS